MMAINFVCSIIILWLSLSPVVALLPPRSPPENLLSEYTLNEKIPIDFYYVDDTFNGEPTHFTYTEKEIDGFVNATRKVLSKFDAVLKQLDLFHKRHEPETFATLANLALSLPKYQWVHYALYLHEDDIRDKRVCVFGSIDPWVEALLLALNAKEVTTLEYNKLTYNHPKVRTLSKSSFDVVFDEESSPYNKYFDVAVSISAFDHDGLGRYGDRLNPSADLEAMDRILPLLTPNTGKLFLTVPIGRDRVIFNLHRQYGSIRLPMLLHAWETIHIIGWTGEDEAFSRDSWKQTYEPVFVLQPKKNVSNTKSEKEKNSADENPVQAVVNEDSVNEHASSNIEHVIDSTPSSDEL